MQDTWSQKNVSKGLAYKVMKEWFGSARLNQYPLKFNPHTWLVLGGRGAGKTRLGAEWINGLARGLPPFTTYEARYKTFALVGETLSDVREVMIEGPSGIARVARTDRPRYEVSRRRLVWPSSGAVAYAFSSEDPDSLRGPQFSAAWCDELGKWKNAEECFDMLQFGLRLGIQPRQLITTTPQTSALLKRLIADKKVYGTRMKTDENAENLAEGFLQTIHDKYDGTRIGRQELDGEFLEDREGALWSRGIIQRISSDVVKDLCRIVIAIDPPASSHKTSDSCGIIAAGIMSGGRIIVLADETRRSVKPIEWASSSIQLFHRLEADCIVAEVNQGGDMVSAVLKSVDPNVPVREVRAQRGKWLRAEPIAALYEQNRVFHVRHFSQLEDEMCDFGPEGLSNGRSPDRVDALVWAITDLTRSIRSPRVRSFS